METNTKKIIAIIFFLFIMISTWVFVLPVHIIKANEYWCDNYYYENVSKFYAGYDLPFLKVEVDCVKYHCETNNPDYSNNLCDLYLREKQEVNE
jgi:hypothetical protein